MKNILHFVWSTSQNGFTMEIFLRKIYSIRPKLLKKCVVLKNEWKRSAHSLYFKYSSVTETYLYFIVTRIIQNLTVIVWFIVIITFFYNYSFSVYTYRCRYCHLLCMYIDYCYRTLHKYKIKALVSFLMLVKWRSNQLLTGSLSYFQP